MPAVHLDELHARVFISQYLTIGTSWDSPNVYSSFWRLYVNDRAGASVLLRDGPYALSAWRVHFVPAWVRFTCHNSRPLGHYYIHFDLVGLPAAVVREIFDRPFTLTREPSLNDAVKRWAAVMRSEKSAELSTLCEVKSLLYRALASLLAELSPEQHARCSRYLLSRTAVTPATEFIDANLAEPLSNAELAHVCHVSEDHFIRVFRQALGQTPAQYILDRRVSAAAQRLIFSKDSVDAIAEATGFSDRFYFSRVFAKRMGSPPAAYRKVDRV